MHSPPSHQHSSYSKPQLQLQLLLQQLDRRRLPLQLLPKTPQPLLSPPSLPRCCLHNPPSLLRSPLLLQQVPRLLHRPLLLKHRLRRKHQPRVCQQQAHQQLPVPCQPQTCGWWCPSCCWTPHPPPHSSQAQHHPPQPHPHQVVLQQASSRWSWMRASAAHSSLRG